MLLLTSLAFAQEPAAVNLTESALSDDTLLATVGTEDAFTGEQLVQTETAPFTIEEVFSQEQGLTAVSPMSPAAGLGGTWIWIAGLAGLGLAYAGRKVLLGDFSTTKTSTSKLQVLDTKGLTANSSLMLVEVETSEGGRRRLLVGIGQGAPTLVADLGGDLPGFPTMDQFDGATSAFELPQPQQKLDQEAEALRESFHEIPIIEEPNDRLSGKFTDDDLAPIEEPAPTVEKAPDATAGVSRKSALASMANNQSRATLGQRPFAASPWSKVVDPPRSPSEAAKRLEKRRALVSDVLSQRAA